MSRRPHNTNPFSSDGDSWHGDLRVNTQGSPNIVVTSHDTTTNFPAPVHHRGQYDEYNHPARYLDGLADGHSQALQQTPSAGSPVGFPGQASQIELQDASGGLSPPGGPTDEYGEVELDATEAEAAVHFVSQLYAHLVLDGLQSSSSASGDNSPTSRVTSSVKRATDFKSCIQGLVGRGGRKKSVPLDSETWTPTGIEHHYQPRPGQEAFVGVATESAGVAGYDDEGHPIMTKFPRTWSPNESSASFLMHPAKDTDSRVILVPGQGTHFMSPSRQPTFSALPYGTGPSFDFVTLPGERGRGVVVHCKTNQVLNQEQAAAYSNLLRQFRGESPSR